MGLGPHYHSGELRKGRHSEPGALYYITKNLLQAFVFSESQRDDCSASFQAFRRNGNLLVHAFVIMPEHVLCGAPHKTWLGLLVCWGSPPSRR